MADREQNESRERFEKWYDDGPYGNCDAYIHTRMLSAWLAAECETLERAAQVAESMIGASRKEIADAIRDLAKG